MSAPTIAVAGLPRCGSSLTMHLLHEAGFPTIGSFQTYEDVEDPEDFQGWDNSFHGKAFKMLSPHRRPILPPQLDLLIWLDRDEEEQAVSTFKLTSLQVSGEIAPVNHDERLSLVNEFRERHRLAFDTCEKIQCRARVELSFERLLSQPLDELQKVSHALGRQIEWNIDCVRHRSPTCYQGMLECELDDGPSSWRRMLAPVLAFSDEFNSQSTE